LLGRSPLRAARSAATVGAVPAPSALTMAREVT
jgi:hypothetical protein